MCQSECVAVFVCDCFARVTILQERVVWHI